MTYPGAFVTGSLEYLRRPFVWNIKSGQKVLILSDTAHDPRVWQAAMSICQEQGCPALLFGWTDSSEALWCGFAVFPRPVRRY